MPRVTISEPGKTPQPYRFKLERKIVKIGRSSESDIIIECGSASTNHCVMERVEGGYILRDSNSTNGIKLDETLMQVIDLFDGMEVLIGDVPMKFQLSDSEIDELSTEEFTTHQKKKLPPNKEKTGTPSGRLASASSAGSAHAHRTPPAVQATSSGPNFFLVFIAMIAAIIIGLSLRHCKETGGEILPAKWLEGKSGQMPADPVKEKEDSETEETTENK